MVKMKLFLFRIILCLFTAINALLISGCFGSVPATPVDSEENGFNKKYFSSATTGFMKIINEISVDFYKPITSDHDSIFISDFRGNKEPEIALISESKLSIYSLTGDLLLEKPFDKYYEPSFIYDIDKDGKSDIIMGTKSAPRNEIVVMNGAGNIISNFREDKSYQDYSSITPVMIFQNRLYATARPADAEAPRGILCFDPFSLDLLYTFYTPDPVGLTLIDVNTENPVIIPSYVTHNDGVFLKYAKESDLRINEDYEKTGALLKISLNGTPLEEHEVLNRNSNILGTLEYTKIPGSKYEILLFHYLSDREENFYHILKIKTSTGEIISQGAKQKGIYLDNIIIPVKSDFLILTSNKDNSYYYLNQFSSNQKLLRTIQVKSRPILKQAILNSEKNGFLAIIIFADGIYTLNREMKLNRIIEGNNFIDIKLYNYKNKNFAVILKNSGLEIYNFILSK